MSSDDITTDIPRAIIQFVNDRCITEIPCGRYGVCSLRISQQHANCGSVSVAIKGILWLYWEVSLCTGKVYSIEPHAEHLVPVNTNTQLWRPLAEFEYADVKFDPSIGKFWVEIGGLSWEFPRKISRSLKLSLRVWRSYHLLYYQMAKIVKYDDGWSNSLISILLRMRTLLLSGRGELSGLIPSNPINFLCSYASLWFFQRVCSFLLCIGT